ncbi:MAG: branched-chain amino acid ABC transporter permease [Elusimicrobia bacterium]|nr:branched-chain amino acid ABC transporter permease [Elusimicrobiota bacterium]
MPIKISPLSKKSPPLSTVGFWVVLAAVALWPVLCGFNPYALRVAGQIGLYVVLALGLNFTLGYAGLFDLGFIAFYAVGAYTAALLSVRGWSFVPATLAAALAAVVVRVWVGIPILRLRGDYLAIVTMGFGEIARLVLNNWDSLTNGPKGLPRVGEAIWPAKIFGFTLSTNTHYYYLIMGAVLLSVLIARRLEDSRLGRAWVAIREDETAAQLSGLPVAQLKLAAFTISAFFAGLAGSIFAHWERFVTPESFVFWESILLVSMIVAGGMGSIKGVILGTVLLGGVPQMLQAVLVGSQWINYRYFVFGLVLVLAVLFRPQGLWPSRRREFEILDQEHAAV